MAMKKTHGDERGSFYKSLAALSINFWISVKSTVPLAGLLYSLSMAVCISGTSLFGIIIVLLPAGLLDFFTGFLGTAGTAVAITGGFSLRLV